MDTLVEEFSHMGIKCEIHWEADPEFANPRQEDNLGIMVCWHPDYYLGDYQITNMVGRGAVKNRFHRDDFEDMAILHRYLTLVEQAPCVLPLAIYEHSGVTMYVGGKHDYPFDSAGWDTTVVGFIYTTPKRIEEMCGDDPQYKDPEWLEKQLRHEVEVYDSWLKGEVYWYRTIDPITGETLDSCGGFVGDTNDIKEEAKESAQSAAYDIWVNEEPIFPEGMRA